MARDLGPACRKCRREGIKLMLKGMRCESAKCPMEKPSRNAPPGGARAFRRGQASEYGKRLREVQKVKRYYGLFDRQFRMLFRRAQRSRENTGDVLLGLLERRLDNVLYKLGFAPSRFAGRQTISHGHVHVNGRRVNVSSYMVDIGDKISIKASERSKKLIKARLEELGEPHVQNWLRLDMTKLEADIVAFPTREDVTIPVEEQLIVEMCSQ